MPAFRKDYGNLASLRSCCSEGKSKKFKSNLMINSQELYYKVLLSMKPNELTQYIQNSSSQIVIPIERHAVCINKISQYILLQYNKILITK